MVWTARGFGKTYGRHAPRPGRDDGCRHRFVFPAPDRFMILSFTALVFAAILIYASCEFFVNGVEWCGRKTGMAENAVGTVLAAFGTALPESIVTLVAVAFGHGPGAKQIGIGAALGGPLVLSTLAYAVVGWTMVATRGRRASAALAINRARLSRDQGWFLLIFVCKITLGLVAFTIKPWLGFVFLGAYALYVWGEINHRDDSEQEPLGPLKIRPHKADPGLAWALLQTAVALAVIFFASELFVEQIEIVAPVLGVPPALSALLLSPVATELPETMNAIIWVRQGKERLALANISGAMMIQATVPSALGLFFTPWLFGPGLIVAGVITTLSIVGLFVLLRRNALTAPRLSLFGLLYVVFVAALLAIRR